MLLQALVESHIQKNVHSGKACQTSLHDVLECILHYNQNMPELFLEHYTHIQPPVCKHLQPGNMLLQALVESHIQKNVHSGKACQTSLHDVLECILHYNQNMPELFLEHYTHIQPPVCKHLQPGNMLLQALVESHIQKNMHSGKACQTALHDVLECILHYNQNMPELFLEHYTHIQPPVCKHLQPGNMLLQALVESHIQKNMHSGKACQTSLHDVLERILHYNQNMPELFLEHYTHIQPPVCKHLQPGNMFLQALVESHIQKNMHSGKACQTSLHDVLERILHYNQNMPELFLKHYTHIHTTSCVQASSARKYVFASSSWVAYPKERALRQSLPNILAWCSRAHPALQPEHAGIILRTLYLHTTSCVQTPSAKRYVFASSSWATTVQPDASTESSLTPSSESAIGPWSVVDNKCCWYARLFGSVVRKDQEISSV